MKQLLYCYTFSILIYQKFDFSNMGRIYKFLIVEGGSTNKKFKLA